MFLAKKRPYLCLFLLQIVVIALTIGIGLVGISAVYGGLDEAWAFLKKVAASDFGQVVFFTLSKNPYQGEFFTVYTPLNFVLAYPFALICKGNGIFYRLAELGVDEYNTLAVGTWEFWVAYVLFVLFFLTASFFLLKGIFRPKNTEEHLLILALLFSNFGVYAIARGSNIQMIAVLVFLFVYLYRSERAWVREIGILALSAAGVCKYYPLIFGVILLKKKDFFGAIRCALYCVLLFILPFFLFEGGLGNLPLFFRNLRYFVGGENRLAEGGNFSIWSLVYRLLSLLGVTNATALSAVCAVSTAVAFVSMTSIAFLTKDMFTESMMFVAVMTLVPPVSYYYLVVFLTLPVLVMVRDWRKMGRRKYFYAVFFSICAFLPTTALPTHIVQALCFVAAIVIEWVHYLKNKHQKERI